MALAMQTGAKVMLKIVPPTFKKDKQGRKLAKIYRQLKSYTNIPLSNMGDSPLSEDELKLKMAEAEPRTRRTITPAKITDSPKKIIPPRTTPIPKQVTSANNSPK